MATKTKRKMVDEKRFQYIKQFTELNLTTKQIVMVTGAGQATVDRIKKAKDFADYKNIIRARVETERAAKKAPKSIEVPRQDAPQEIAEDGTVRKTFFFTPAEQSAVELTRIANALERLADAWEAKPGKGFFNR